jgi:hypothetical protein
MPTITIFTFSEMLKMEKAIECLNGKKKGESWISARVNKYNKDEIFIQYWYYEDVENGIKRVFSEEDSYEIVSFLKENGKNRVLKRTYCFINFITKTLEIYRGPDAKAGEILQLLEKCLKIKFIPLSLTTDQLTKIYSRHSLELKQVLFKNINGLIYDILRGNSLEANMKFNEYMKMFPSSLRVISFRPKIKFMNEHNKYQVTINGDKGTLRVSSNDVFQFRPRFEIRQLIFILAATIGILAS